MTIHRPLHKGFSVKETAPVPDGGGSQVWKVFQSRQSKSVALLSSGVPMSIYTRLARVEKTGGGVTIQYITVFKYIFVLDTERESISSFWNRFILLCCCWGAAEISVDDWIFMVDENWKRSCNCTFFFFTCTSWRLGQMHRSWVNSIIYINFCSLMILKT